MPERPALVKQATDARSVADESWGYRAHRLRYKRQHEEGLKILAEGYPSICAAQVNLARTNPLAAKWVSDQLGFVMRETDDTSGATTNILQLVIGSTNNQPPASIPAEWRVLPPPEPSISHKVHSAKYDEGDNASS